MRILHCGTFGSTYALVEAQRELGHKVDLMEYFRSPLNLPHDFSLGLENQHPSVSQGINFYLRNLFNGSFVRMIRDYDIYHLHHCAFILPRQMGIDIQLVRLLNRARLSKKKILLHYHGHDVFLYHHHKSIWAKGIKKIVSTPNLLKYDDTFKYIPNGINLEKIEQFKKENKNKTKKDSSVIKVVHATVHEGKNRAWKGTERIEEMIKELKKEGYEFEFMLKEKAPREECWLAYMGADIAIDQICYDIGWHGVFSLENAAFGNAILCYINPELEEQFLKNSPLINVNFDSFKDILVRLLERKTLLNEKKKQSLEWVKNYDIKKIAKIWDTIYKECVENNGRL